MARRVAIDGIGDINFDWYVDDDDILLLEQFIVGKLTPTDEEFRRADVNGDGILNALDITTMKLYMNHISDILPACIAD